MKSALLLALLLSGASLAQKAAPPPVAEPSAQDMIDARLCCTNKLRV